MNEIQCIYVFISASPFLLDGAATCECLYRTAAHQFIISVEEQETKR